MFSGRSVLAVVPARGGSKGIPRKNLATVGGRTLIEWAATTLRGLDFVELLILSTDDDEMAEEAGRHGLEVPFRRPPELSHDLAPAIPMWQHAWVEAERWAGTTFDLSILLQPTSPLRRPDDVTRTVEALFEPEVEAATTVSLVPSHFAPEKTMVLEPDGMLRDYVGSDRTQSIRQLIPNYYFRNGYCYAAWRSTLVDRGTLTESGCAAVVIERPTVNIDEPFDLEVAEWLWQQGHGQSGEEP